MTKDCRKYKSFKLTKEQINKIIQHHSKAIVCLDLNGNFVKEYSSVSEAAQELNDQSTNISKACKKGCSRSVKGFMFVYKSDYDPEKEYKHTRYLPQGEHLKKMINNSRLKSARKVYEYKNGEIIKTYNSASELEKELLLKKDTLRSFYNKSKEETEFKVKDRVFKIEKSRSYKDIV